MEFQLSNLLPSDLVRVLGITLFHSLWIGLVLALITSLVIMFTRKSTALVRYNLLTGSLFLFVLVTAIAFYLSANSFKAEEAAAEGTKTTGTAITNTGNQILYAATPDVINQIDGVMNLWLSYSGQIVLIWFLIILAKSIQMLAGLHNVSYLKRTRVFSAGQYWENKVGTLSAKLQVSRTVGILQSGLAKVPMVAGHFKPIILVPLGLLNGLSEAEVEAIISHELAHVKRRDYVVNIMQSLVEILFFFNPAVLWVSRLIREERENCCDDLALTCTESKQDYIKALISCQEFQSNVPGYAMAVTGKKNQLLQRVSRMVFNSNSSLNSIEKTVLTLVLVFTLLFTAAFTKSSKPVHQAAAYKNTLTHRTGQQESILQDTSKKVKRTVSSSTTVPQSGKGKKVIHHEEINNENEIIAVREEVKAAREEARAAKAEAAAAIAEINAARANMKAPPAPRMPRVPRSPNPAIPAAPAMPAIPAAPPMPAVPPAPPRNNANAVTDAIRNELLSDKLISQTKNMSYKISKDEFVVNGKTQSDALRKKYMRKFLKHEKQTIQTTVATD